MRSVGHAFRVPSRCLSSSVCRGKAQSISFNGTAFRVAIVGSGPSGFYATSKLLSLPGSEKVHVDLFEELPTPFGLVRYGVAPDHPEVKNCQHKFEEVAEDPRFRFFGNVQVGSASGDAPVADADFVPPSPSVQASPLREAATLPLEFLRDHYDAVLLTYGAALDRPLRIPGETELANIFSARDFVHFYNGHPSASLLKLDLSRVEHVTVIGQGNVALDCARVLLSSADALRQTDIPEPVLAELARSRVRRVDIVGRRGPLQIAGTTKEMRELLDLPETAFQVDRKLITEAASTLATFESERAKKRLISLIEQRSMGDSTGSAKSWSLGFLRSPLAFGADQSSPRLARDLQGPLPVKHIEWDVNELVGHDPLHARVRATGVTETTSTDLVLKSIGYRSIGIRGLPFDDRAGVVRNIQGRVVDSKDEVVPGLYVSGWLARGPTGVIATTMFDAYLTAEIIASDATLRASTFQRSQGDVQSALGGTGRAVSWTDWKHIDAHERERGKRLGKPREKMTSVTEMLAVLGG